MIRNEATLGPFKIVGSDRGNNFECHGCFWPARYLITVTGEEIVSVELTDTEFARLVRTMEAMLPASPARI